MNLIVLDTTPKIAISTDELTDADYRQALAIGITKLVELGEIKTQSAKGKYKGVPIHKLI